MQMMNEQESEKMKNAKMPKVGSKQPDKKKEDAGSENW